MYKAIYSPYKILGKKVMNRLVAQSMEINAATDTNEVSKVIIERYKKLAQGKWGIVFVEALAVDKNSLARLHGMYLCDSTADGYKRLVDSYRQECEDGLILFQITHAGRNNFIKSKRIKVYNDNSNQIPIATNSEIEDIRNSYINAVKAAYNAGADGVDIKACHGYFLSEMLRPANIRDDIYGKSRVNRARFLTSIIKEVKKMFPDFIVGTRISLYEAIRGGCGTAAPNEIIEDLDDMLSIISLIIDAGADFLNISAGTPMETPRLTRPGVNSALNMQNHFRYTKIIKENFPGIPVIGSSYSAGKIKGTHWAEENISKEYADFAGFGRQNLADPYYPVKLASSPELINYCTLCGGCSKLLKEQKTVYCTTYNGNMY